MRELLNQIHYTTSANLSLSEIIVLSVLAIGMTAKISNGFRPYTVSF